MGLYFSIVNLMNVTSFLTQFLLYLQNKGLRDVFQERLMFTIKRFLSGILFVFLFSSASQATLNDDHFFILENIKIQSTQGPNLRQNAINAGIQKGFQDLLNRITLETDKPKIKTWLKADIPLFVKNFALQNEDMSPEFYSAEMTLRLDEEAFKQYARENNISLSFAPKRRFLILPIYIESQEISYGAGQNAGVFQNDFAVLWFDPNPWFKAWQAKNIYRPNVEFILPYRDLDDLKRAQVQKLLSGDKATLKNLARKYQVDDVFICVAKTTSTQLDITLNPQGKPRENIVAHFHYSLAQDPFTPVYERKMSEEQLVNSLFNQTIDKMLLEVEEGWKAHNLLPLDQRLFQIHVTADIETLRDWQNIKKILDSNHDIPSYSVLSLGRLNAQILVKSYLTTDELIEIFQSHDINTTNEQKNIIHLRFDKKETMPYLDKSDKVDEVQTKEPSKQHVESTK